MRATSFIKCDVGGETADGLTSRHGIATGYTGEKHFEVAGRSALAPLYTYNLSSI